jgi:hypothetical protein
LCPERAPSRLLLLVLAAVLLALAAPTVASAKPTRCFLSVAKAHDIVAHYEAREIKLGNTGSFTYGGTDRRRHARTVVLWVQENDVMMSGDSDWVWHHPIHVTVRGSRAHVALEGARLTTPFSMPYRC